MLRQSDFSGRYGNEGRVLSSEVASAGSVVLAAGVCTHGRHAHTHGLVNTVGVVLTPSLPPQVTWPSSVLQAAMVSVYVVRRATGSQASMAVGCFPKLWHLVSWGLGNAHLAAGPGRVMPWTAGLLFL